MYVGFVCNWRRVVGDRYSDRIVSSGVSFCCLHDVTAKALRMLLLVDTLSAT